MVTVADIIRADKTGVEVGEWRQGKLTPSVFPIAKPRSIPVGPSWSWRLVRFEALGFDCRVLLRLNEERARFHALLAIEYEQQLYVVCHHELHIPDKNWHCHFVSGDVLKTMPGVLRDRERMRVWETEPSRANDVQFTVTRNSALTIAAGRFRFAAQGELV